MVDAPLPSAREEETAGGWARGSSATLRAHAPHLVLAAAIVVAFGAYAALATGISSPRVFVDELVYWDAAVSLADGAGLTVRGEPFRFAPLLPLVLAPILVVTTDLELAYGLAKLLNALAFALTAVPVFLLSRRLLSEWPSVVAAALSVAVPSAMYASVVMTESLAYLAAAWALYAMVRAVESPTAPRQLLALLAILVATAARPQLVALVAAYAAALALSWLLLPTRHVRAPRGLVGLWPTGLALALAGAAIVVLPVLRGTSPAAVLGGYDALWRSYDLTEVARWFVYHLANLELYLAVVPLAVAPMVVVSLLARTRAGSEAHAAFLTVFLTSNALLLVLVASFNSTEFALGRIHDRYVFYLVPLWLVVLLFWLADGAPRPVLAALVGAAIAVVLPLLLPFSTYAADEDGTQRFNGIASGPWAAVHAAVGDTPGVSGRSVLVVVTVALVVAAFMAPRRFLWLTPVVVLAGFMLTAQVNWLVAADAADDRGASVLDGERGWLDESVPAGTGVTFLFVDGGCGRLAVTREALALSEFFSRVSVRGADVGKPASGLPSRPATVVDDGRFVDASGAPLIARFVVAQPGVPLVGRRIRDATRAELVLWETGAVVRVRGATSNRELQRATCRAARP